MPVIELGSAPYDENCVQVGEENYFIRMKHECAIYIGQLYRIFPKATEKRVKFETRTNNHDFGSYLEVVAVYSNGDDEAMGFAYDVESNLPRKWDNVSDYQVALNFYNNNPVYS